ncbi:aconitase iron-sulfur domain-containing protein [Trichoderma citrinoviride]|uniref:Aconitase iron-sulfur domain-containing protein n=1 Tax=Trichoderma citrinoviride TaxID=58853 RepID=A0A2T4BK54_9HYPO|nr:aconitase iron-sulfur domain-containing protein [Trichoderma citrinoviride]PTB69696.1 aconitase iron-sulfur domain-containing protein [Trichoderma citrinoviride]
MAPIELAGRSGGAMTLSQSLLRRASSRSAAGALNRALRTPSSNRFSTVSSLPPTYEKLLTRYTDVRRVLGRQRLTLAEKILYSHLDNVEESLLTNTDGGRSIRGKANLLLKPDRVNMQDASAQMALLQFMSCKLERPAIPASIHCDHLIVGSRGAEDDLAAGIQTNKEIFDFLESAARKFGMDFWPPGAGIIHQTVLENYALPGLMMLGTDSHSPNAGGLCTVTIGVGGADAVEALVGAPWELKAPKVLGVQLTGKLGDWVAPKDVILKLAGELTVRGGTGSIIEYFGPGVDTLSATGMATICNMGAEVGATTSIFPYTEASARYLQSTRRGQAVDNIKALQSFAGNSTSEDARFQFKADEGAEYDQLITINLSELEPHVNGPFTPDLATPLSKFKDVPRYLGARVVLTKSFARIHETNLKKQGVVPLTFENEADYDRISAGDEVSTIGLYDMLRNQGKGDVQLKVKKANGEEFVIPTKHTVSKDQAGFILAGSALNLLSKRT